MHVFSAILGLALVISSNSEAANRTPASESPSPTPVRRKQNRDAYREELAKQIADNHVPCKADADCETLAVGARACGGPVEFMLITKGTRTKILEAVTDLTKTIEELDRTALEERGKVGICMAILEPKPRCNVRNGMCVEKN